MLFNSDILENPEKHKAAEEVPQLKPKFVLTSRMKLIGFQTTGPRAPGLIFGVWGSITFA